MVLEPLGLIQRHNHVSTLTEMSLDHVGLRCGCRQQDRPGVLEGMPVLDSEKRISMTQ